MIRVGLISLVIAALMLPGCGKLAEKAVEKGTGVDVDQKGNAVTIKGSDGQQVTYSAEVPKELKDFPVPNGFKLDSGGSVSSNADKTAVAVWKGKSTISAVIDFYKNTMPGKGWKEDSNFTTDDGGLLSYSKDGNSVMVTIDKSSDQIEISVILGKASQ